MRQLLMPREVMRVSIYSTLRHKSELVVEELVLEPEPVVELETCSEVFPQRQLVNQQGWAISTFFATTRSSSS